jgi:hypothetical protein
MKSDECDKSDGSKISSDGREMYKGDKLALSVAIYTVKCHHIHR